MHDAEIGRNFQKLSPSMVKFYQTTAKSLAGVTLQFLPRITQIGKLQLLRKLVVR
jgi:hypothetical protein